MEDNDSSDAFAGIPVEIIGHREHGITVEHKPHGLLSRVSQNGVPSQVFVGPNAMRDSRAHAHNLHMVSMINLMTKGNGYGSQ